MAYEDKHAETPELARALLMMAIGEIERTRAEWMAAESDPSSSDWDRCERRRLFNLTRNDFQYQWANVRFLLMECDTCPRRG